MFTFPRHICAQARDLRDALNYIKAHIKHYEHNTEFKSIN